MLMQLRGRECRRRDASEACGRRMGRGVCGHKGDRKEVHRQSQTWVQVASSYEEHSARMRVFHRSNAPAP